MARSRTRSLRQCLSLSDSDNNRRLEQSSQSPTLSWKSRQAWPNALLSKNIDHSRFARPSPKGLAFILMLKPLIVHNAAIWECFNLVCELSWGEEAFVNFLAWRAILKVLRPVNMILYVRPCKVKGCIEYRYKFSICNALLKWLYCNNSVMKCHHVAVANNKGAFCHSPIRDLIWRLERSIPSCLLKKDIVFRQKDSGMSNKCPYLYRTFEIMPF